MDALSATPTSTTAAALPVQPMRSEVPPAPSSPTVAQQVSVAQSLPALPAAVQRTQLEQPPAKLMTREEMAAILALTS